MYMYDPGNLCIISTACYYQNEYSIFHTTCTSQDCFCSINHEFVEPMPYSYYFHHVASQQWMCWSMSWLVIYTSTCIVDIMVHHVHLPGCLRNRPTVQISHDGPICLLSFPFIARTLTLLKILFLGYIIASWDYGQCLLFWCDKIIAMCGLSFFSNWQN